MKISVEILVELIQEGCESDEILGLLRELYHGMDIYELRSTKEWLDEVVEKAEEQVERIRKNQELRQLEKEKSEKPAENSTAKSESKEEIWVGDYVKVVEDGTKGMYVSGEIYQVGQIERAGGVLIYGKLGSMYGLPGGAIELVEKGPDFFQTEYRVGDVVSVRPDLVADNRYNGVRFDEEMAEYKLLTLSRAFLSGARVLYECEENDYNWTAEMFAVRVINDKYHERWKSISKPAKAEIPYKGTASEFPYPEEGKTEFVVGQTVHIKNTNKTFKIKKICEGLMVIPSNGTWKTKYGVVYMDEFGSAYLGEDIEG